MRILLANDDGIRSNGLVHLARVAARLGEVWVVAPAGQCSAMSHRITVFGGIDLHEEKDFPVAGVHAFRIDGSPADCVKVALAHVMPQRPDVVFSGINRGYNVGRDILYSGTVGVTMEALTNNIPAIAFSAGMSDDLRVADEQLPAIARALLQRPLEQAVWNVNFPDCCPEALQGVLEDRFPSARQYFCNQYLPSPLPDGGTRLTLSSVAETQAEPGSDMDAIFRNYISIGILPNTLPAGAR